jgi:hypothetical protein
LATIENFDRVLSPKLFNSDAGFCAI